MLGFEMLKMFAFYHDKTVYGKINRQLQFLIVHISLHPGAYQLILR